MIFGCKKKMNDRSFFLDTILFSFHDALMSTLYFIRHGQASFGKSDYDQLSEKGKKQARLLAGYLHKNDFRFDIIIRGPQKRHEQTAHELIEIYRSCGRPCPDTLCMEELAEYDFTSVLKILMPVIISEDEQMNRNAARMFDEPKAFQRLFEAVMMRWVNGDPAIPHDISWEAFKSRVNRGIDSIMEKFGRGAHIGVFTSGGPISVSIQRALGLSGETAMQLNWQIVNCSVTRFKCTQDRIMLASFNEYPWLETHADRSLVTNNNKDKE
ncbi:MAG: hypothetical protein B5M56_02015 [Desulfococcus sp. 4484_241]|nr:MAG: hypothetical protein B5M56_02015 [Desulfococcus sp. 4484_241]